jgi:hypothetical protein
MKRNRWTTTLVGAGLLSLPAVLNAGEQPASVLTALAPTTLSGYVDTSAQWNLGTGNANVPSYAFGGSSKADGFNLNVVRLCVDRPAQPTDGWGAGYKVDLLFGPDADFLATQSSGVAGDFGVKQAYVALRAPVGNGLDFKLGVWDTIMGYEVTESVNNPNYTRSYGYSIEPSTHTGLQAAYQFSESISAIAAVADTFGSKINQRAFPARAESYKAFMLSVTLVAPTNWGVLAGAVVSGTIMNGFNSGSPVAGAAADQTSYYLGASMNTPVKGLKVGVAYDYAGVSAQPLTADKSGYAHVVGVYASYQLTEKLTLNGRGEYAGSSQQSTFLARDLYAATATLQYDLWKNVLSRLEFRWDHAADGSTPFGGRTFADPGSKRNSFILLANIAYKF